MKLSKIMLLAVALMVLISAQATAAGDAAAGEAKSQACAGCHGAAGVSAMTSFPILAGQFEDYLFNALSQYKSGGRKNAIMTGIAAGLSKQDMRDLAAYYTALEGVYSLNLPE
jgi:cytochrome c553|tara:strand:- start:21224 stop:21562 length:339 start_codon:yes stop_codon:yes gene_type:complete